MEKTSSIAARHYYKPFATGSPILIILLLLTLTLIGLIEYACRIIPAHSGIGELGNVMNNTLKLDISDDILRRQIESETYVSITEPSSPTPTSTGLESTSPTSVETEWVPIIASTPAGGYLSLGDEAPPSTTDRPQSGYLSVGDQAAPTLTQDPPNELHGTPSPTIFIAESGFLSVGGDSIIPQVTGTPADGYLEVGTVGGLEIPTTEVSNNYPPPSIIVSDGTTMTLVPATPTPFIVVENGITLTRTPSLNLITPTPGVPRSGYLKATGSSPAKPSETIVNGTGTFFVYEDGRSQVAPQITERQYILVSFVPLIVAVLFTIPWRIVDTTIREMEPFYQLQKEGGAQAEYSLCLDYNTSTLFTTPFKALIRGHFLVFWSSLISIAILVLAPLSSEAFFVSLSGQCGPNLPPCRATWGVFTLLARMIEGILAFMAILVVLLIIFGSRRKSGVYSEPLSIAGLAALYHNSPLLRGFREIDSRVNNEQLGGILTGKRYGISAYISHDQKPHYGILPADPDSEAGFPSIARVGKKGQYRLVEGADVPRDGFGKPIRGETMEVKAGVWSKIRAHLLQISTCFLVSGLLALITYYHWSSGENGFEWFMNSQGFGVRFMMSGLGVLLNILWSTIDKDLRKMEPYRRLLLGGSKAEDSILIPVWMDPFSALLPSLRRGHFLVALICFVTILSEFLPIALANIGFSPAMTKTAYTVCNYLSMAILIIMLGSILTLIFRPRNHIKELPRSPTTLASILLYITSTGYMDGPGLLDNFEGMSLLSTGERNSYIEGLGNYYSMGLVVGDDLRIDEDTRIRRLWAN